MVVELESPGQKAPIAYRLMGPHGLPIEGEWYTNTFRDLVFAQRKPDGSTTLLKGPSTSDIAKAKEEDQARFSERPLVYAGVENQYFAVVVEPKPGPGSPKDGWVASATPAVIHDNPDNHAKADISFELTTKPELVNPGHPEIPRLSRLRRAEDLRSAPALRRHRPRLVPQGLAIPDHRRCRHLPLQERDRPAPGPDLRPDQAGRAAAGAATGSRSSC